MMDMTREGVKGSHVRTVKEEAIKELLKQKLYGEEGKTLSKRIKYCGKGSLCQSIYCYDCSSNLSHKMFLRWIKQHEKGRVMYATTLLDGVCRMNERELRKWLKNFRRKMTLCKKKYPDIFVSFELEPVPQAVEPPIKTILNSSLFKKSVLPIFNIGFGKYH